MIIVYDCWYIQEMTIKVLGLDPGTLRMGCGVLAFHSGGIECLDHSLIVCPKKYSMGERLFLLSEKLSEIFEKHRPDHVALEKVFFGKNADSAFKLGQAFGIGLYQSQKWSCSVYEYAPRTVKKSVTGTGGASKESVYACIQNILKVSPNSIDSSDALALALCHIYQYQAQQAIQSAESKEAQ